MDEEHRNKRALTLGYRPQKENVYNQLLPYAKHLDEESEKLFVAIKTNLIKSVLAREMRPGCALWTSKLNKYIKIYGLKFSKEDHIALIKLFYELMTIPDLEPTRINKCAFTLSELLKKKYLLSRDDLQLDWRPLYEVRLKTIEKSKSDVGMYRYFSTFESTLSHAIRHCKVYFPASATQEILDEFRPQLCPFNALHITQAVQSLELFLPNAVKPEEAPISYHLWFDEFMNLWEVCHNAGAWENSMMWILTGVARYQMGHIDWSPYVSKMFARFLRSFQLPVNFRQKQVSKQYKIDTAAMAVWIVCCLHGDNNPTFFHLEKMMQTLESYYHSANAGRWTMKLRELLKKLSYFFVRRVYWEMYGTSWDTKVPDSYKLTDKDIDRFVNILKPCAESALFSRVGSQDVAMTLAYLASLRPNLMIPGILDKLYASMDSLTEPHKLTSTMMATVSVARYMIQGNRYNYPEGPTHAIPLLMALLPGIDPNDIRKSIVTFNLIVQFVNMIPLIDSSEAHNYYDDLSEEEHMICEATAALEDFVLQFFDRLLVWVDSSSLDFVRLEQTTSNNDTKNKTESLAENAVSSVVGVVINQCSPRIFHSALRKFYNFATQKILEVQVAGKLVGLALHRFVTKNPAETLKMFLPFLLDSLTDALNENPHLVDEEHVDATFLYHLLLLSEAMNGKEHILQYLNQLTTVLDQTLHMKCLEVNHLATKMLELLVASLAHVRIVETKSCTFDYGTPVQEILPIRHWAKPFKIQDLELSWYVPKEREIQAVQDLVNKYLIPELDAINKYVGDELKLSRQQLKCRLKIITSILSCHLLLPLWEEPTYKLADSVLDSWAFNLMVVEKGQVTMPDGSNVRKTVVNTLHELQKKLLACDEGDTQSMLHIINIYNIILFNKSKYHDFEMHWKAFHLAKQNLADRLHQRKQHLRHLHLDRVLLQQEFRVESRSCSFTATHKQILDDLFTLGVSRYSEVRMAAQTKLFAVVQYFPYSYTLLTDHIKRVLRLNSIENHEQFKGCLYLLLGPKSSPIVARHDWEFVKEIWPLLVRSMPSEKPSIVNLITTLTECVHKFFPTIAIKLVIPERALTVAMNFANVGPFTCDLTSFKPYVDQGQEYLRQKSMERRNAYDLTVNSLLDSLEDGNLHWRYNAMAIGFIKSLVHFDVNYSTRVVKFFLKATINESLYVRKNAIKVLAFIAVQNKPKFEKVTVDPFKFSSSSKEANSRRLVPGVREDNAWLLYNSKTVPKTAEQWEELRYLHDQCTGYYTWPKDLKLYAPPSQQKTVATRLDQMTDTEKEIYQFFTNEDNVAHLIKYFSLEENKGIDQFNPYRFLAFKNIFKMFEDLLLPLFVPHIEKLVEDKQESSQRCAAELIAAIIRGSKHWRFEQVQNLWNIMLPILAKAMLNMGNETIVDWTLCFTVAVESRDPNMHHWLLEFLMEDPLRDATSFVACNRLHLLSVVVTQQSWRNTEIFARLLDCFRPHLTHPFQSIRDKISHCLSIIYGKDLVFPCGNITQGPTIEEFFKEVTPQLDRLYRFLLTKMKVNDKSDSEESSDNSNAISIGDAEKEELLRLFKTVAKFTTNTMVMVNFSARAEFFKLLPLAVILQNYETDEEVSNVASHLLVVLGQTMTVQKYIPHALESIEEVTECLLWSGRAVLAEFLPVFVFYNMPTIQSNRQWVLQVQNLVLRLLEDPQPEVRLEAAKICNGLLHCQFIPEPTELLSIFKQKARTKIKRGKTPNSESNKNLIVRHGGVLGLCSFINAHPYDVPEYLPAVFEALGSNLSDPQPIPATIRKTMGDFKRTHHDNWEVHKLKFTEEELSILSDLSVPPSYYV